MKNEPLKHRAWDEGKSVMHNDFEFITSGHDDGDWIIFKSDKQLLSTDSVLSNPHFRKQLKIMPETMRQDKDGKLAFVGDMIEFTVAEIEFTSDIANYISETPLYHGVIIKVNNEFLVKLDKNDLVDEHDSSFGALIFNTIAQYITPYVRLSEVETFEITGNIYEGKSAKNKPTIDAMMKKGLWCKRMDWCKKNNLPPATTKYWDMSLVGVTTGKSYAELLETRKTK